MVHTNNSAVSNTAADSEGELGHEDCTDPLPCEQKDSFHTGVEPSPKLHCQFIHRGLSVISDGLRSLENVAELLQLLQGVSQLPPHHLQLPLQHLDALDVVELVRLAAVERVLQIDRWDEQREKGKVRGSHEQTRIFPTE